MGLSGDDTMGLSGDATRQRRTISCGVALERRKFCEDSAVNPLAFVFFFCFVLLREKVNRRWQLDGYDDQIVRLATRGIGACDPPGDAQRCPLFFASLPTKIDPYIRPLSPRVISTKSSTQTRRSSLATEAFRRQRNPQAVKLSRPARVVASRSCLLARVDACRSRLRRRLSTAGG
jgi:hypothetical protein